MFVATVINAFLL